MDQEAYAKHNKPEAGAVPGVYKHPGTSEELWAETFPAADAFVRQGWVFERDLPSAEERAKAAVSFASVAKDTDEVTQLRKELAEAKAALAAEPHADVEKQLSKMNKTELLAIAEAEGVEVDAEATNKQLVEAIEAKRAEGKTE